MERCAIATSLSDLLVDGSRVVDRRQPAAAVVVERGAKEEACVRDVCHKGYTAELRFSPNTDKRSASVCGQLESEVCGLLLSTHQ